MKKQAYIDEKIAILLHSWSSIAMQSGSLVILSLGILDYFVTPENFKTFFLYRFVAAIAIFAASLINRKKIGRMRHHVLSISAAVIVS